MEHCSVEIEYQTYDLERLDACPVCGSGRLRPYLKGVHYGANLTISMCASCGLAFLNPRMTDEQTRRYYGGTYRDLLGGGRGVFMNDLNGQRIRAAYQIGQLAPLMGERRTLLEIGCSAGNLMDEFTWRGFSVTGVEPDTRYHKVDPARRYTVYADIQDVPVQAYDVIAMSHVLEHMNRPVEYLRSLDDYTHPDTLLVIEVPNSAEDSFVLIHHPILFTADTLHATLLRAGWVCVMENRHCLGQPGKKDRYILAVYRKGN